MYLFPLVLLLLSTTLAQYPPEVTNLTVITSPVDGNIKISYKSPKSDICRTAFDSQKQYTGWVNIPGAYETNTFFWFIEGRQATSQLTIWLNGGPGSSSMLGLFNENGPCEVVELANGKFGTQVREWGWDRGSNILYIDQPNQVGFSYDVPTNCSMDLLTSILYTSEQTLPNSQPANTFLNGTFSSLDRKSTANTTEIASKAIWHMLQGFLGAFPQYGPKNSKEMGVHLFAQSYGGKYGPVFANLWEEQNAKLANGTLSNTTNIDIKLESLGLINACVDDLVQAPYYPVMAVNNTYDVAAINPTRAKLASASFYAPGGCRDLIKKCRSAVTSLDPENAGNVPSVASACSSAYNTCTSDVMAPYFDAGRSVYDIAHLLPESFPPSTYLEYLNTPELLQAIGSPVNYTETNIQVVDAFTSSGDHERQALIPDIAALLQAGIRVGLMYGDRDYICNWLGGEALSLAIATEVSPIYAKSFPAAGYAPIITNTTYIGGVVRQFGNLSFSRIYDAGHSVPAYQPETAFQVFARIMKGTSISTGKTIDINTYDTSGPTNATYANSLPSSPSATCCLRTISDTCTPDDKKKIVAGKGAIINGVLYSKSEDWSSQSESSTSSVRSSTADVTVTTTELTGFFTAMSTPDSRKSLAVHDVSGFSVGFLGLICFTTSGLMAAIW